MISCTVQEQLDGWEHHLPELCSFSSPRPVELTGDGILDIIIGAGRAEFAPTDSAILAFDGKSGELLWQTPGWDQMVGSAIFLHIDSDGIEDIIIGGRRGQLYALSGESGEILWSYYQRSDLMRAQQSDSNLSNFYIPQIIPDQNEDGLEDLLITHGGDAMKHPLDPNRPQGQIIVISSQDGQTLARVGTPDSAEIYMSALCADLNGDGRLTVLFGTGGEGFEGNFYRVPLEDILDGSMQNLKLLVAGQGRGFISPPVLADINHDNILDIVVNAVEGKTVAVDGNNDSILWQVEVPGTEVYSSIAVGNFTGDATPDFFTNFGVGVFPNVEASIQLLIDGQKGEIVFHDSLGYLQIGSPLSADLNKDGYDEAILTINESEEAMASGYFVSLFGASNKLVAFDFQSHEVYTLMGPYKGINAASTPWIGDLDQDNLMDIVYSYMIDTLKYKPFNGMKIHRQELDISLDECEIWGSYMGSNYDGILITR